MKIGLYRHYQGKYYQVIGVSRHSETLEEMIIYRALYGDYGLWVRPKHMFQEMVTINGKERPRFEFIHELDNEPPALR